MTETASLQQLWIVFAAILLGCLTVVVWRRETRQLGVPGVLSLVLLDLTLGFGVGGIYYGGFAENTRVFVSATAIMQAVLLGTLGAMLLTAGYLILGDPAIIRDARRPVDRLVENATHPASLVVLEVVGWFARVQQVAEGSYFHIRDVSETERPSVLVQLVAQAPTLVVAILITRRWRDGRSAGACWLLAVAEIVWFLPTGARAPLVALVLALVLCRINSGRKINKTALAAAVAFIALVLFPLVQTYRGNDTGYSRDITTSARLAIGQTSSSSSPLWVQGVESTLSRFSDVFSAAVVFQSRDVVYPSSTNPLGYVTTSFIPRTLSPNKPDPGQFGNEFGRRYGMIRSVDNRTSIAVSHPLHGFLIGGWAIACLYCLLSGVAFRALNNFLLVGSSQVRDAVYAITAFAIATSVGTIWPLGFVGVAKSIAILFAMMAISAAIASLFKRPRRHFQIPSETIRRGSTL